MKRKQKQTIQKAAPVPVSVPETRSIPARQHIFLLLLVFAAGIIFYLRTAHYPFVNWDDERYIHDNPLIRSLSWENIKGMFTQAHFVLYIPLTLISYALNYQFSFYDPAGYRLTNILLHAVNGLGVYGLVFLIQRRWFTALAAALIFALHPVQIESVIWIAERKNVLSTFFFIFAMLSYARFRQSGSKQFIYLLATGILYVLGILSKPNVIVLPAVLLAYDLAFGYLNKKEWSRYAPFCLMAVIFAYVTISLVKKTAGLEYHGGSFYTSMLVTTVVIMKYFQLYFWPWKLSLLYSFPVYETPFDLPVLLSLLGLAVVAWGIFRCWKQRKDWFFWAAWYFLLLAPILNIVPSTTLMNDRYLYVPIIGLSVVVFSALEKKIGIKIAAVILFASAAACAGLNYQRQAAWKDPETLWLETQASTENWHRSPYLNLGMHYVSSGEPDKAIEQFIQVLKLQDGHAPALDGLGIAYYEKKDYAQAEKYFKLAQEADPAAASPYNNLGTLYKNQQRFEDALAQITKAVEIDPENIRYRSNQGSIFLDLDRDEEAIAALLEAIRMDPDRPETLYNLGIAYMRAGQADKAREVYQRLIERHPDWAEQGQQQLANLNNSAAAEN